MTKSEGLVFHSEQFQLKLKTKQQFTLQNVFKGQDSTKLVYQFCDFIISQLQSIENFGHQANELGAICPPLKKGSLRQKAVTNCASWFFHQSKTQLPRKHKPLQNVLNKTSLKRIFVNSKKHLQNVLMKRFLNTSHKTFVKRFVNAY